MATIGPFGFKAGLNTKAFGSTLPKDALSDAQNIMILWEDLYKRNGSVALNSAAIGSGDPVHGVFDWISVAGQRYLLATAGGGIYRMNDLNGTFVDITGTVSITAGQNQLHTWASLNNYVVSCAPTDVPIAWQGSGNSSNLAGSPPTGSIVTTANNFMFLSGNTTNPSRIWWSNVADPTTWSAANNLDFRLSDGDKITALSNIGLNVVIFKRRSMGTLSSLTQTVAGSITLGPLTEISPSVGCPGPLCVDKLPDGRLIFFGTNAHVYIFDGVILQDISDPAYPASNVQPTLDVLNPTRFPFVSVKTYPTRQQVWISYSAGTSTTNNHILVYNYLYNYWESVHTGIKANVLTNIIDTRTTPSHAVVMVTGNYAGKCYEQDRGSSDAETTGNAIPAYANISIDLGKEKSDFIPISLVIPYEAQSLVSSINVNYGYDGYNTFFKSFIFPDSIAGVGLDAFVLDEDVLAAMGYARTVEQISGRGRCVSVQLQFQNLQANQPFQIHPFYISDEVAI